MLYSDESIFNFFESSEYQKYKRVKGWVSKLEESIDFFFMFILPFIMYVIAINYLITKIYESNHIIYKLGASVCTVVLAFFFLFTPLMMFSFAIWEYLLKEVFKIILNKIWKINELEGRYTFNENKVKEYVHSYMNDKKNSVENLIRENLSNPSDFVKSEQEFIKRYGIIKKAAASMDIPEAANFLKEAEELIKNDFQTLMPDKSQKSIDIEAFKSEVTKEVDPPKKFTFTPRRVNWLEIAKMREGIGEAGEQIVLDYEIQKMKRLNKIELIPEIEHSSKVKGDGLGFDIRSFDEQGEEIFIEVKSTSGGLKNDIFFTRNELSVMSQLKEKYYLYRVYNLDIENESAEILIFKGKNDIDEYFKFTQETVRAKYEGK